MADVEPSQVIDSSVHSLLSAQNEITAGDQLHSRLQAVVALLAKAALPNSDLADVDMKDFFLVGSTTAPVAVIGVQLHDQDALLRSLVVSDEYRARVLGGALVDRAVAV